MYAARKYQLFESIVLCKLVPPFMNVIFIVVLPEDSIFHLNVNQVIDLAAESNTLYPQHWKSREAGSKR